MASSRPIIMPLQPPSDSASQLSNSLSPPSPQPPRRRPSSPPVVQRSASKRRKQFQRTRLAVVPQISTSSEDGTIEPGQRSRNSFRRPSPASPLSSQRASLVEQEQALQVHTTQATNSLQVPQQVNSRRCSLKVIPPTSTSSSRRPSYCVQPPGGGGLIRQASLNSSRRESVNSAAPSTSSHPRTLSTLGSNIRTKRSAKAWELREAKKKAKDKKEEEDGSQVPVVPMAGAVVIASVLGGPVCLMAGIKLGMVAALGGGIMGYTTGRLIEEHGEAESLMKGEYNFSGCFNHIIILSGKTSKHGSPL